MSEWWQAQALFKNQARGSGWSHSFYFFQESAQAVVTRAKRCWFQLVHETFARNVLLEYIRVSSVNVSGDALISPMYAAGKEGNLSQNEEHEALICHGRITDGRKVIYIIKGWSPNSILRTFGADNILLQAEAAGAFAAFNNALVDEGAAVRTINAMLPSTGRIVEEIVYNDLFFQYEITTQAPHGGETGDTFYFGGKSTKNFPALKGNQTVVVLNPNQLAVRIPKDCHDTPYDGGFKVWRRFHSFNLLTSMEAVRIGTRKSGRPFGVPVGRT